MVILCTESAERDALGISPFPAQQIRDAVLNSRGGKGLKAFTFNKNGSNGNILAGALYVTEPYNFTIRQKTSSATTFDTEFVPIDARAGKGCMLVMALMEDVVTGLERA